MKVKVSIEFEDAAEAHRYVGLLPGVPQASMPAPPVPDHQPNSDPFADVRREPTPLILSHLDKITDLQLRDLCTAKANEFKAADKDGLTLIKKLITEYGELGKGVGAIHDSKRVAFKTAVEALAP